MTGWLVVIEEKSGDKVDFFTYVWENVADAQAHAQDYGARVVEVREMEGSRYFFEKQLTYITEQTSSKPRRLPFRRRRQSNSAAPTPLLR